MENLSLVRIDDRLIHGQVMTAWVKHFNAKNIVIIDDEVADDDFMTSVIEMAAPKEVDVLIFTVEEAITELADGLGDPTIILVKEPEVLLALINGGIDITDIDVAGMGMKNDRSVLFRNISASPSERDTFRTLLDKGVNIFIQIMPKDKPLGISELL